MILVYFLVLAAGFAALVKGADMFVDGSASLAKKFNVSELVIGLTIVALGTSAPEFAVSTTAALSHSNELALSNVVGSNIFNLLVVLGFCAMFSPIPISSGDHKERFFPFSILVTVAVLVFGGGLAMGGAESRTIGMISRPEGLILLALFLAYMIFLVTNAKNDPQPDAEAGLYADISLKNACLLMIVGITLIVAGGQAVAVNSR